MAAQPGPGAQGQVGAFPWRLWWRGCIPAPGVRPAPHTGSSRVVQEQPLPAPQPRARDWFSWLALTIGPNLRGPKAND